MSAYQFQALQKNGSATKGILEADSERHARQLIRDQGLIPTHILGLARTRSGSYAKTTLSSADLALFTRQLATLLAAGIPVEESLGGVSEQTGKNKVRELIIGIRARVLEGYGLAQAMAQYPHAFPELYRATVNSGEHTGRLDRVLEQLADYTENQQQTRQKMQHALIYPLIMIGVSSTIICFLLSFVVPKIIEVFTSSGQTLPAMTVLLIQLSHFIKEYGLYIVMTLIFGCIGFKKSLSQIKIKKFWHRLLLKLPFISYWVKTVNVSRYIHTFGILFAAGVSVLETMRVAASLVTNVEMQQAFDRAATKVKEGCGIHNALKETGSIPPMAIHLIASGEKSGQLSPMMERAALHLDDTMKRLIDTLLNLLEPLVIVLMGAIVLFIVLATLLPIFSMEQVIT